MNLLKRLILISMINLASQGSLAGTCVVSWNDYSASSKQEVTTSADCENEAAILAQGICEDAAELKAAPEKQEVSYSFMSIHGIVSGSLTQACD